MKDWLVENAAPVIRYRTMTELVHVSNNKLLQETMDALLALPQVQKRLNLLNNLDYKRTHGSNSTCLENVLPMLNDFGLYYGTEKFRQNTMNIADVSEIVLDDDYDKIIAYPFLLRSKFPIDGLLDFVTQRINTIYDFTRHMDYDIYDNETDYKGVPASFRGRPIVKPTVSHRLPLIYDIVAFAEVYERVSPNMQAKIDNIIQYIIAPEYDIVEPMYGIQCFMQRRDNFSTGWSYSEPLRASQWKYYAMGWDCKKPFNDNKGYSNPNLHRLMLYSCFPTAVKSMWFQNAIGYLTQYKTSDGTYIFPKEYLPEYDSNWILGSRMSLAENRRKKNWREIESTFYMLKILNSQNS